MKVALAVLASAAISVSVALPAPLKKLDDWAHSGPSTEVACEPQGAGIDDFSCKIVDSKSSQRYAGTISVTHSFDQYGWDFMSVATSAKYGFSDNIQALAAGYLEGHEMSEVRLVVPRIVCPSTHGVFLTRP